MTSFTRYTVFNISELYYNFAIGLIFTILSLFYTIIASVILYNVIMKPMNMKLNQLCRSICGKICERRKKNETNFD